VSAKGGAASVGIGAVACAACCAGPILGVLGAVGLGAAAGVALFGALGLAIAGVVAVVLIRRRRRRPGCPVDEAPPQGVPVEMSRARVRTPG